VTVTHSTSGRPWTRAWSFALLLAGLALAASLALYCDFLVTNPELWHHSDEWVYRAAGIMAQLHPADLYRARMGAPGEAQLPFTYPPFAALVFGAFSWLSFAGWQVAIVVTDLLLLPVIAFAAMRIAGHRGPRVLVYTLAVTAVALWFEPVYWTLYFGQINLILLALVLIDLTLPDTCKWKGVGIGLAAAMKLTPLVFIPFLLASRRVRAGLTSLAVFAATVAIGFAVLPTASLQFWRGLSPAGAGGAQKILDQSINGVVQRIFQQQSPADVVWAAAALVVACAGVAVSAAASRRGQELLGVVLCGVTGLLVSPISWTHHWVWTVPALALLVAGQAGWNGLRVRPRDWVGRAAGTAALLALFFAWPDHALRVGSQSKWFPEGFLRQTPHGFSVKYGWTEYTWHGFTWILGNSYVLAGLVAIAGTAGYLWVTRRSDGLAAVTGRADEARPAPARAPVPAGR
jgi:alpha-1,2-mannosyltransferase